MRPKHHKLICRAEKDGNVVLVEIHYGFTKRTDGTYRFGSSVYQHNLPDSTLLDFTRVCGNHMGCGIYEYIAQGVTFLVLGTDEPILDDTTTAIQGDRSDPEPQCERIKTGNGYEQKRCPHAAKYNVVYVSGDTYRFCQYCVRPARKVPGVKITLLNP